MAAQKSKTGQPARQGKPVRMDKVVHFEIPADNPSRAQRFYAGVFGWQIDKAPMPDAEYYMIKTVETDEQQMPVEAGAINGGLMRRMTKGETPVIVIDVASLDEALKRAEKAGGTVVMPKMQVGDMGLYARVADTEGNVIGIWQNLGRFSR